jgi:hypothetical protein
MMQHDDPFGVIPDCPKRCGSGARLGRSYARPWSQPGSQVQYARTTVQDNASTRFIKSISDILQHVGFFLQLCGRVRRNQRWKSASLGGHQRVRQRGEIIQDSP